MLVSAPQRRCPSTGFPCACWAIGTPRIISAPIAGQRTEANGSSLLLESWEETWKRHYFVTSGPPNHQAPMPLRIQSRITPWLVLPKIHRQGQGLFFNHWSIHSSIGPVILLLHVTATMYSEDSSPDVRAQWKFESLFTQSAGKIALAFAVHPHLAKWLVFNGPVKKKMKPAGPKCSIVFWCKKNAIVYFPTPSPKKKNMFKQLRNYYSTCVSL